MEVPPDKAIFVFGVGDEVRELLREVVRTFGRSEIRLPAADGGGLGEAVRETDAEEDVDLGNCRASG